VRHTIHVPSEELCPCVTIDDFKEEARTLNPLDFIINFVGLQPSSKFGCIGVSQLSKDKT
jgi:hypothetical protein